MSYLIVCQHNIPLDMTIIIVFEGAQKIPLNESNLFWEFFKSYPAHNNNLVTFKPAFCDRNDRINISKNFHIDLSLCVSKKFLRA